MTKTGLGIAIAEAGIGSVLTKYALQVPLNQRSYAWDETHVKTLLEDFSSAIASDNKTYFLGTIVLTSPRRPAEIRHHRDTHLSDTGPSLQGLILGEGGGCKIHRELPS